MCKIHLEKSGGMKFRNKFALNFKIQKEVQMKISENLSNLKNAIDKAAKNDLDASATGSFLQNLEKANKETEKIYEKLEKELKSDAQMFKQFDFMQMMTKLQYGNLKSSEREELINKMSKIAKEI